MPACTDKDTFEQEEQNVACDVKEVGGEASVPQHEEKASASQHRPLSRTALTPEDASSQMPVSNDVEVLLSPVQDQPVCLNRADLLANGIAPETGSDNSAKALLGKPDSGAQAQEDSFPSAHDLTAKAAASAPPQDISGADPPTPVDEHAEGVAHASREELQSSAFSDFGEQQGKGNVAPGTSATCIAVLDSEAPERCKRGNQGVSSFVFWIAIVNAQCLRIEVVQSSCPS